MKRIGMVGGCLLLAAVVGGASCEMPWNRTAQQQGRDVAASAQDPYEDIGEHDPGTNNDVRPCGINCVGFLPQKPSPENTNRSYIERFRSLRPAGTAGFWDRKKEDENAHGKARLSVQGTLTSRQVALNGINRNQAQILAVLSPDIGAVKDSRYGISWDDVKDLDKQRVYVVASDYNPDPRDDRGSRDPLGPSRRAARWELWGLRPRGNNRFELVKLGKSGWIRWCGHPHEQSTKDSIALFTKCNGPMAADSLRRDTIAMDLLKRFVATKAAIVEGAEEGSFAWIASATLGYVQDTTVKPLGLTPSQQAADEHIRAVAARLSDPDAPAWFICGIGCCIADS